MYIERRVAIARTVRIECEQECPGMDFVEIRKMLANIPAADVVEVVRCKDCKHYHEREGWCDKHSHFIGIEGEACHPWESNDWKMFELDDFCSYGERREP